MGSEPTVRIGLPNGESLTFTDYSAYAEVSLTNEQKEALHSVLAALGDMVECEMLIGSDGIPLLKPKKNLTDEQVEALRKWMDAHGK
jgi:hypothetical protein